MARIIRAQLADGCGLHRRDRSWGRAADNDCWLRWTDSRHKPLLMWDRGAQATKNDGRVLARLLLSGITGGAIEPVRWET